MFSTWRRSVIIVGLILVVFSQPTLLGAQTPTPSSMVPNPASWFWSIPTNLHNFLEQLYTLVYYFNRPSNMTYLLDGLTDASHTTPAPTPTAASTNTPTARPTATATPRPSVTATPTPASSANLDDPYKKEIAMELVCSAENSSLDWKAQYGYIEDIGDGRGYTGGIIGFTSGTHDMLELVQYYTQISPNNILAKYIPALQNVDGTSSHTGLGNAYVTDWKTAANDTMFQKAQNDERDRVYFNPALSQGKADGLHVLGQFIYYDALVMHGPGNDSVSFGGIRKTAMNHAQTPAQGGNEVTYLNAFLDARKAAMLTEAAHDDTSRVDTEQRKFLNEGNMDLHLPLSWSTYGDPYTISSVTP